jgi:hypothetical protein
VSWTEPDRGCVLDGSDFGGIDIHACGGVDHFAFVGIVDERLKVVRALFDYKSHPLELCFDPLPVAHLRQYYSAPAWIANRTPIAYRTRSSTMPVTTTRTSTRLRF